MLGTDIMDIGLGRQRAYNVKVIIMHCAGGSFEDDTVLRRLATKYGLQDGSIVRPREQ